MNRKTLKEGNGRMAWRNFVGAAAWLVICSSAVFSPALADPTRDRVMDGAARCEGIPDNRVWLDCFYGSAQPMRALLGLAPAPESQTRLVPTPGTAYGGGAALSRHAPAQPKSEGFWSAIVRNTKPLGGDTPVTPHGFVPDGRVTGPLAG